MIYDEPRFLPGGDRYMLIEFGNEMNLELNFMAQGLATAIGAQRIGGVIETAPCFASMLIHYEPDDIFRGPAVRPGMIASWLVGFMVYEWLSQTQGLGFWTDFLARLHPPHSQIGASLPSFAVAFALGALVSLAARRTGSLALSRQT